MLHVDPSPFQLKHCTPLRPYALGTTPSNFLVAPYSIQVTSCTDRSGSAGRVTDCHVYTLERFQVWGSSLVYDNHLWTISWPLRNPFYSSVVLCSLLHLSVNHLFCRLQSSLRSHISFLNCCPVIINSISFHGSLCYYRKGLSRIISFSCLFVLPPNIFRPKYLQRAKRTVPSLIKWWSLFASSDQSLQRPLPSALHTVWSFNKRLLLVYGCRWVSCTCDSALNTIFFEPPRDFRRARHRCWSRRLYTFFWWQRLGFSRGLGKQ